MTAAQNGAGPAPDGPAPSPGALQVDVQEVLDYSATLFAQQLVTATTEAARWRSAALGAQRLLVDLQARIEALEASQAGPGGPLGDPGGPTLRDLAPVADRFPAGGPDAE